MEGEIISRENIKPSSPTPPDKRTHKISLLDQIFLSVFVPLVLYYPNLQNTVTSKKNSTSANSTDEFISRTTQILKHSLSTTLSLFYPFAGRFNDRFSVDCNNQGMPFLAVKFKESLSDFLKKPDPAICRVHTPVPLATESDVAMVQVNYFACGGIAIGSAFSHKVADGVTMVAFVKSWAAATAAVGRDSEEETLIFAPNYTALSLFPQNLSMPMEVHLFYHLRKLVRIGKSTMRRYVFGALAISKLRDQLLQSSSSPPDEALERRRPSRVELVSALLWKCYIVASAKYVVGNQNDDDSSMCFISHLVNIRRRANPPLPEYSFGNFVWSTTESTLMNSQTTHRGDHLKQVFGKVRSALSKVDLDFVKRMQGEEGYPGYYKNVQETWDGVPKENANALSFTSWCNFGLYDADFGWGKPTWISKCDAGNNNTESRFVQVVWLTDTRDGDGIEAWLTMDHRYYDEFDKMEELTDLVYVDPSPLDIYNQSPLSNH